MKPGAPTHRRMLALEVVRSRPVSPHLLRLTVGGAGLADFEYQGLDQCIRVFFPRPGQSALRMPTLANTGWAAQFYLMPTSTRPRVRNYTVRAFRRAQLELDIDFVVHGDGPAATWASAVRPGDPVGIFDEGTMYRLREGAGWQLLVGDESALPAVLAIAEQSPPALPTTIHLEVPTGADVLPLELGESVTVNWLPRDHADVVPGQVALEAVAGAPLPAGAGSVFLAGESGMVTGLRRALVGRGVPKAAVTFFGYWKHGRASLG